MLQREIAGSQYVVVRQLDAEISLPIAVGVERDDGVGAVVALSQFSSRVMELLGTDEIERVAN